MTSVSNAKDINVWRIKTKPQSGQHPEGQHPEGQHPEGQHPEGQHSVGQHPKGSVSTPSVNIPRVCPLLDEVISSIYMFRIA